MAKQGAKAKTKPSTTSGRVRKLSKKQTKIKARKQAKSSKKLSGSFKLTTHVFKLLVLHWRPLAGIVVVYLLLNIVFASGISNVSASFSSIRDNIDANNGAGLLHAFSGFASLIGSAGSSGSSTGSTLQSILFIIESLVIIWALRHLLSGQAITVKQAYYKSMTPLIPFILVIAVIIIQLLPATIGVTILTAVITSIFTGSGLASVLSAIVFIGLATWSLYMVSSSIFAMYIVTLPDMQPRQALRSARDLVRYRRNAVIRKLLFLPLFIFAVMGVVVVPLIKFLPAVVPLVFYILSMLAILFIHSYFYSIYREMIDER